MKYAARFFSVVFHPLILLNFGLFTILKFHPYFISKIYDNRFYTVSMFIAVNTLVMPLLSIYLLKRFRFIDDFEISDPKQRLIPYGIMVILLIFTCWQLYNIELFGLPLVFLGASAFCLLLNILINLRFTISSHGIAAGGLTGLYVYLTVLEHVSEFNFLLIASILAAGISFWSRLYLNAHTERQIYSGFLLGLLSIATACILFI